MLSNGCANGAVYRGLRRERLLHDRRNVDISAVNHFFVFKRPIKIVNNFCFIYLADEPIDWYAKKHVRDNQRHDKRRRGSFFEANNSQHSCTLSVISRA